jgi:hypothetical protein
VQKREHTVLLCFTVTRWGCFWPSTAQHLLPFLLCRFNFEMYLMSCEEHSALFKKEPAGRQGRAVAG